ncbi:MAG: PP2C family serine/threonine-protein phosphatase [Actinomycetota bacterium]
MAELKWGSGTHAGQIRAQNEDSVLADHGIFVVADGMGGHEAGEVASGLAIDRLRTTLGGDRLTAHEVVEAITSANGDIFRAAIANPGQAGMGTTVTLIAVVEDPLAGRGAPNIDDNDPIERDADGQPRVTPVVPLEQPEALVLANVGDSRTYLFRHDRLRRITVDHNYVQELVATGHITDDEARIHPRRNIITRALGIEPDVDVDWWTLPIIRGDRFVLCSDGLVDEVRDDDIAEILRVHADPQAAADELITRANDAGGRDNVTVIVVDVLEGDDPPDPTVELDVIPQWGGGTDGDITLLDTADIDVIGEPAVASAAERAARDGGSTTLAALVSEPTLPPPTVRPLDVPDGEPGGTGGTLPPPPPGATTPGRRRRLRFLVVAVVVAALVAGGVAGAAWARRGFFVDFGDDGRVTVFQGRPGGVLWIEPTVAALGDPRTELTENAVASVEATPRFDSLADAQDFVLSLERIDGDEPTDSSDSADSDDPPPPDSTGADPVDDAPPTSEP